MLNYWSEAPTINDLAFAISAAFIKPETTEDSTFEAPSPEDMKAFFASVGMAQGGFAHGAR